jgi:hypothetical protein
MWMMVSLLMIQGLFVAACLMIAPTIDYARASNEIEELMQVLGQMAHMNACGDDFTQIDTDGILVNLEQYSASV